MHFFGGQIGVETSRMQPIPLKRNPDDPSETKCAKTKENPKRRRPLGPILDPGPKGQGRGQWEAPQRDDIFVWSDFVLLSILCVCGFLSVFVDILINRLATLNIPGYVFA